MRDSFEQEVLEISRDSRCIQHTPGKWNVRGIRCFLGVPPNSSWGWCAFTEIPQNVSGFHFYLGGTPTTLIESFARSPYPQYIEYLALGASSFGVYEGLEYSELVKILGNVQFPKLKELKLGVWELFHNSGCLYGRLGDVTKLLQGAPNLEILELYGCFELSQKLAFPNLQEIQVQLDSDVFSPGSGSISNNSLSNLLTSDFPVLEEADIDLSFADNQYGYIVPEELLVRGEFPNLRSLRLAGGFLEGEKEKLEQSPFWQKRMFFADLRDMIKK